MTIPVQKLGWVAGVLDLKGRIITKNNKQRATKQFVLIVETKDIRVINELCSLTGTHVELKAERNMPDWMRRPCTEHCPEQHVHVHSGRKGDYDWKMPAIARWTATGCTAAVILYNVLPFSLANIGLEVALQALLDQAALTGQGSGATMAAIRRMKDLGWELPPKFEEALRKYEGVRAGAAAMAEYGDAE